MTISIVEDKDIRYKKGTYNNVRCRLCKNNETRTLSNGDQLWIEDLDITGTWTGQYLCYECSYNREKICCRCGTERVIKSIGMTRYYDGNGTWTGKYICDSCHNRNRTDYKNRNISLTIKEGTGSIMDVVVATVLEVQTCSIYIGGKTLPFHIIHGNYGIIGTKISKLRYDKWYFNINDYIMADTYFCIGLDEMLKDIKAVFVITSEDKINDDGMLKTGRLTISKNSKKYKKFEIDPKLYDEVYKSFINDNDNDN